MPSVDEQSFFVENCVRNLFEISIPIRSREVSGNSRPWFNTSVRRLIDARNYAYARWKRFRTSELKNVFRTARKNVNDGIRNAKREYYTRRFGSAIGSKHTWNRIREIGIGTPKGSVNCKLDAEELNRAFTNIPFVPTDESLYNFPEFGNIDVGDSLFQFSCVTQLEVLTCFNQVKSNAVGVDNIHPRFIKILLPYILPYITYLFNSIITTCTFPSNFKLARIIPLAKTDTEFRPIAILCYLSKVLEKILYNQMSSFLSSNNLFCDRQSGFRSGHSCVTALLDVSEGIRRKMDVGNLGFLVLLDHSKAFDSVDYDLLIKKLKHFFKFSYNSIRLLRSYLTERWQFVYTNSSQSSPLQLFRGVPQGSILGPLLFALYINDLPRHLEFCNVHMYADDVQLYICSPLSSVSETIVKLNSDLERIFRWATANGLLLNPRKSKCLFIHRRTVSPVIDRDIVINGEKLKIVNSAKNLGLIFNSNLTWTDHINVLVGNIYVKLRSLWSTKFFTPLRIRMLLAKSYLIPSLLYGCELFASCDSVSEHRLVVLYNNILRYVFGLSRYDHVSHFSSQLLGVSLDNFLKIRALILFHKIVYSRAPRYLLDRIRFASSPRGRKVILPYHRFLTSDWHFFIYASRLWNSLPPTQQLNRNAISFRKFLFDFYK